MTSSSISHSLASTGSRQRDPWLDNVKVLAITLVVVGHGLGLIRSQTGAAIVLSNFIYLFHMPLFAAMSGWTIQRLTASGDGFRKICLQLLVPYLIFDTIAAAVIAVSQDTDFRPTFDLPSFGLWYLLSLASWRILWPWIRDLDPVRMLVGSVVVAVSIGYIARFGHAFSLSRTFFFLPAFLTGAYFGPQLQPLLRRPSVRWGSTVVLLGGLVVAFLTRESLDRTWIQGRDAYSSGTVFSSALWRTVAILAGIALALAAASVATARRSAVTKLGNYTLYAYLLHIVIRQVVVELGVVPKDSGMVGLVAMIVACIVLTLFLMTAPVRAVTWPLVDPGRFGRPTSVATGGIGVAPADSTRPVDS
jgi:fucose 4-O-acetylase-like acetyltransferase